jgi:hypothetical protein
VYDPSVFLIASVCEGVGADDVPLALDVELSELESDEEELLWVLDALFTVETRLELWLDETELEETDEELLLGTLAEFVPFLM